MARLFLLGPLALVCACSGEPTDQPTEGGMCLPPAARPSQRNAHDAVYVPSTNRILLFGGDAAPFDPNGMSPPVYLDELWRYDPRCGTWDQAASSNVGPGQRGSYAAALDGKRGRLLLFGGRETEGGSRVLDDVWALDVKSGAWRELSPNGVGPRARQSHRVVYDESHDRLLLYGGNTTTIFGNGPIGDTYELSFSDRADGAWRRIAVPGPAARQDVAAALDSKRGLWLIFGGAFDFVRYDDGVWAFDLLDESWRKIAIIGERPSKRFWGEMIYDKARDRMVLFGGHDDGPIGQLNDTWAFTLSEDGASGTWRRLLIGDTSLKREGVDQGSPERRSKQSLVAVGDTAWLFGGISDCGPLDDVWTLDLTSPTAWKSTWKAQVNETCARRATGTKTCPSDCGPPL